MKRLFALMLCLCLCLALAPAGVQGATLVGDGGSWLSGQGEVKPYSTAAQSGAAQLPRALDDTVSTCWSYTAWTSTGQDDIPEATFYFNGETLAEIWLRAGNQASLEEYWGNAFPSKVRVRLWQNGGTYVDYTYQLDDYFQPGVITQDWQNGYQRLALPQAVPGVNRAEFFIPEWRSGSTNAYNVCISDILFASSGSGTGYVSPGYPSTPGVPSGPSNTGSPSSSANHSTGNGVDAPLLMRMATRSGPSTNYDGLGSYFTEGDWVTVMTKAYDKRNGIWWVQVEFKYQGTPRRAYTGVKRVDVDLDFIPEEYAICQAHVDYACDAYYGPGTSFSRHKNPIPAGTFGTVFNTENGFAQLEFQDGSNKRRVWLPTDALTMY